MKALKNYFKHAHTAFFFKNQTTRISLKNSRKGIDNYGFNLLLLLAFALTLFGCGKPSANPGPNGSSGCSISSDVDQALGVRNFEYDDKGNLAKITAPNYYYGPFVRTITAGKVVDSYPSEGVNGDGTHFKSTINTTYTYNGGSGNIYDGNPEFMNELYSQSNPPQTYKTDSIFQFKYDDAKKHLTAVLMQGSGSTDATGFVLFRYELDFGYDANDNVTDVKIMYDWSRRVFVYPSSVPDHIDYKQTSVGFLTITYDDKPSAYTAISKYWKFIGEDAKGFHAYNLDEVRFWADRCEIMSKNNPVTITGKLLLDTQTPLAVNAKLTYQYNDKNFPVSMAIDGNGVQAFTYTCR